VVGRFVGAGSDVAQLSKWMLISKFFAKSLHRAPKGPNQVRKTTGEEDDTDEGRENEDFAETEHAWYVTGARCFRQR
jgi:hypothetical protein